MNEALLRGMSDAEFLATVRYEASTPLEIMLIDRMTETGGVGERIEELEGEVSAVESENDKLAGEIEDLEADIRNRDEYIDALLKFVAENDPDSDLLNRHEWL